MESNHNNFQRELSSAEKQSLNWMITKINDYIIHHRKAVEKNSNGRRDDVKKILSAIYGYANMNVNFDSLLKEKNFKLPNVNENAIPPPLISALDKYNNLLTNLSNISKQIKKGAFNSTSALEDTLTEISYKDNHKDVISDLASKKREQEKENENNKKLEPLRKQKQEAEKSLKEKLHAEEKAKLKQMVANQVDENVTINESNPFLKLPREMKLHVMSFLSPEEKAKMRRVTKDLKNLVDTNFKPPKTFIYFENIDKTKFDPLTYFNKDLISKLQNLRLTAAHEKFSSRIYQSDESYEKNLNLQSKFQDMSTDIRGSQIYNPNLFNYVLEIDLTKNQILSLLKQEKYDEIISHMQKVHPISPQAKVESMDIEVTKKGTNYEISEKVNTMSLKPK